MCENEIKFLKKYNKDEFEKPSITTDIAIFSVSNGDKESYRRLSAKSLSVLLVKRDNYPYKDKWCLPGSFMRMDETLDDAAVRILADETNLHNIYLEQLYTFSALDRDPRMRILSTSYVALIDKNKLDEELSEKASWFDMNYIENDKEIIVELNNGQETFSFKAKKILKEKTTDRYSYEIIENNNIAFDHAKVIITGINRIKNKLEYTDIVFNMMPKEFTLGELQQVYEVILGKKLLDPAFRRIIADKVVKTGNMSKGGGHRPSALFKFKDA